jgi:hypothetical protein
MLATGMIPPAWLAPLAYGLPAVEAALAVALATRVLAVPALLMSTFLSTVFVGLHVYLLASGTLIPCGCAGVAVDLSSDGFHVAVLVVSTVMLVASLVLLFSGAPIPRGRAGPSTAPEASA